ncbi:SDR family oxidoreductase [Microbacterium sp.]|uniref:SDR family oxidoreductase n=1 Tax=Microbacterium sp. TaxID=51671 RepID=UPI003C731104
MLEPNIQWCSTAIISGAHRSKYPVSVSAVAAGPTRTPGTTAAIPVLTALAAAYPAGRLLEPAEVADAIAYLVDAPYLHGTILAVDGGASAVVPSPR